MNKQILIVLVVVLMVGLVGAGHSLYNIVGIDVPEGVIAGNEFEVNFSFDYLYDGENEDGSPLIIELNVTSEDETYPVMKGDFVISGRIEKSWLFDLFTIKTVYFDCSEEYEQTIEHSLDTQNVFAENGTFYCYNEEGDLSLNERDKVYLDITSHQAIYPGNYNLTASMFYLTDKKAPFVNITNKGLFEKYYRENDNVVVEATINDGSEVEKVWAMAFLGYENWSLHEEEWDKDYYMATRDTSEDIVEDDYDLFVFAKDNNNNTGNDSVTLKIDRTAPEITLIKWEKESYKDIIPIGFNVTDEKSGVDNNSVKVRLREVTESLGICPETGGLINETSCVTTPWISLTLNVSSNLFELDFNTTEYGITNNSDGSYWLDAQASDILNNQIFWIA